MDRARRGESRAGEFLRARGYDVIAAQSVGGYAVSVDGEEVEVMLRADYLVARDGLRYVAEVKTGARAPHLRTPATRRQLLEYGVAFDVDGILLVDAEEWRIHEIRFPAPRRPTARATPIDFSPFGVAIAVAILVALVVLELR